MWEEWNKWKGGDQWNEEWNDDDWRVDWGQPGQAFDRYAVLDGQVSLSKMKEGNSEQASTQANKKKHGNDSKKISEKAAKKANLLPKPKPMMTVVTQLMMMMRYPPLMKSSESMTLQST